MYTLTLNRSPSVSGGRYQSVKIVPPKGSACARGMKEIVSSAARQRYPLTLIPVALLFALSPGISLIPNQVFKRPLSGPALVSLSTRYKERVWVTGSSSFPTPKQPLIKTEVVKRKVKQIIFWYIMAYMRKIVRYFQRFLQLAPGRRPTYRKEVKKELGRRSDITPWRSL